MSVKDDRSQEELADDTDEGQQEGRGNDRFECGQQDDSEDLPVGAAVDDGGLIELAGDGVEGSLDEPHLTQGPTHERQAVTGERVQTKGGDDLADVGDHRVDGDHGQDRREHHDQEQGQQTSATSGETEAGEGVGPEQGEKYLGGSHYRADDDGVEVPAQEGPRAPASRFW